jgi:hypothetical protein
MNSGTHRQPRGVPAWVCSTPSLATRRAGIRGNLLPSLSPRAIWQRFKRLTQIGFPRRFVIVQFPNAPLIIAFVAGEIGKHVQGSGHAYASSVSYLALVIWAYLELVEGANWFRRLLGLTYVIDNGAPRPGVAELAAAGHNVLGNGCA